MNSEQGLEIFDGMNVAFDGIVDPVQLVGA